MQILGGRCYGSDVTILGNGVDLNTLTPGYYRTVLSNGTHTLVNRPDEVTGYLTWIAVIGIDTNVPQTYLSQILIASHYGIFWRVSESNVWGSWHKISMS